MASINWISIGKTNLKKKSNLWPKNTLKISVLCQYLSSLWFRFENKRKKWQQTCVWMTPTTKHKHSWAASGEKKKNILKTAPKILHQFVLYKLNNSMLASVCKMCCYSLFFHHIFKIHGFRLLTISLEYLSLFIFQTYTFRCVNVIQCLFMLINWFYGNK